MSLVVLPWGASRVATYSNVLAILQQIKVVPYAGDGVRRENGGANYGFKNLKGSPHLIGAIPELDSDRALRSLIETINAAHTGLFSVGCASGEVKEDSGYRYTGYVEVALNSKSAVADAGNYFPAFFHFDRLLSERRFQHPVQFYWELQPARFTDVNVNGFTCSVYVNTSFFPSVEEAYQCWTAALGLLTLYFGSIPVQPNERIY